MTKHRLQSSSSKTLAAQLLFLLTLSLFWIYQPSQAATLNVPSSQYPTIQSAVNAANAGDTIVLQAGMTFVESVRLKYKPGNQYITIQSSAIGNLPPDGHRVNPSFAAQMPKIAPPASAYGEPAFYTEITPSGASHHYRLVGLEIKQNNPSNLVYSLVSLGSSENDQNTLEKVAHHFIIDRCYIHGDVNGEVRRGVALNSSYTEILNSYISEIHQFYSDAQAIGGWNGPGQYRIINNHLEGAAENILFGGADPSIPNLVPSDIEIRHNTISKPMSWRDRTPKWMVKNLFELKNARRVVIDGNLFENAWGFAFGAAQNGPAIVLTPRNQNNTAPWSTIEDVKITNNIVRRAGTGVSILGTDDTYPSQTMKNLTISNNLFVDIGISEMGGMGDVFGFSNVRTGTGAQNVVITNNTAFHTGMFLRGEEAAKVSGLLVQGNINREHVIKADVAGTNALNQLAGTTWTFRKNAFTIENYYTYWSPQYPNAGTNTNSYLSSFDGVRFVNKTGGNYRLAPNSPHRNQDGAGKDVGVDFNKMKPSLNTSDFDSDGKTDVVVWRPTSGVWYVLNSADNSMRSFGFGQNGDVPASGDYDGDGQTDYAVWRPANGIWYIWQSSASQLKTVAFGLNGDIPVPADYDADGKTDFAVFRANALTGNNGYWYILRSSTNSMEAWQWGSAGDKPVVGDYDSDGKADPAVFRPSSKMWYIRNSFDATMQAYNFGDADDLRVQGDYDGDGRLDIAVYRPSNGAWYIRNSSNASITSVSFGSFGDIVAPGDYDGDGKTDAAVFRPSTGIWYLRQSTAGLKALGFGTNGDRPTALAAVQPE